MKWLLRRFRERTTWLSVIGVLGLFGMRLDPELQEYIIQGLIAASCIVAFLFPESDLAKKDDLPPIDLVARSEPEPEPEPERVRESELPSGDHPQVEDGRWRDEGFNG